MSIVIYPVVAGSQSADSFSRRAAVPIRYACPTLPPNYISDSTDGWNCNICSGQKLFYQPYIKGDIIPFQTQFADNYNNPADVLSASFYGSAFPTDYYVLVELLDGDGATVTNLIESICDEFWVGYSLKTGSVQTWFVNTGLFPTAVKCWSLKITYYKINQSTLLPEIERTIYTQEFKEVESCIDTVKIESYYPTSDCNNNYYNQFSNILGIGSTPYFNFLRVIGKVEFMGESNETTTNDRGTIISQTITENFSVFSGLIPTYYFKKISQAVRGNRVFFDGVQYETFSLSEKNDGDSMFPLDIEMTKKCRLDNKSCNF
jgi:hypothetical protein